MNISPHLILQLLMLTCSVTIYIYTNDVYGKMLNEYEAINMTMNPIPTINVVRMPYYNSDNNICIEKNYFECMVTIGEYLTEKIWTNYTSPYIEKGELNIYDITIVDYDSPRTITPIPRAIHILQELMIFQLVIVVIFVIFMIIVLTRRIVSTIDNIKLYQYIISGMCLAAMIALILTFVLAHDYVIQVDDYYNYGWRNGARLAGIDWQGERVSAFVDCENNFDCYNKIWQLWDSTNTSFVRVDRVNRYQFNPVNYWWYCRLSSLV